MSSPVAAAWAITGCVWLSGAILLYCGYFYV